ncbi:MFS transporter [Glaciibacter psychrotolerans]|uniref:Na+/melibiose symporter-like transporter n=1 Tax=Glaciibacter psychrotolerans TaxID=670054 RepID=A0A7Z0J4Q2_9MICO|nr:MFS transporter [Leifsonia psychrotolerans]NYJ18321.1 Na+/melibiose symporter-like transporter [Leifsonia psychrotolerans]
MDATTQTLPRRTIAAYAIGSLGTGGFATLPGLVLVYYLTDTLGIAALAAGLVVTVAKIWDVVIDPVIGSLSDRSLAVTGSRRRFMRLGAMLLPIFFILTFAVPAAVDTVPAAVWVTLAFLLCATAFSLFQVPYIALPAELTSGYDDRTRLLTWRVVVLALAILLFGAGGPLLRSLSADPRLGYLLMAVAAGIVIGVGMLVSSTIAPRTRARTRVRTDAAPRASATTAASIGQSYRSSVAVLRRSPPFRALLATFVLQGLATGLMLAGAQYIATWVLHSEDAVTFLFVALIAPALLLAPAWGRLANRIGKERAFVWASLLFALAALAMVGQLWAPGEWVYLPVALAGAAYAGMQSLPMAMLPDVISHDAKTHGEGSAGLFGGVWTAGETTGMALGATVLTLVLSASGYIASVGNTGIMQPDSAVAGIVLSFSIVPAAIMVASLLTLTRYGLRKADVDSIPTAKAHS